LSLRTGSVYICVSMGGSFLPVYRSRWQPDLADKENAQRWATLLEELAQYYEAARFQGREKHIQKARAQGKLLARERIAYLLDEGSPFLELMPLAGLGGTTSSPGAPL